MKRQPKNQQQKQNCSDVVPPSLLTNNVAVEKEIMGKCNTPKKIIIAKLAEDVNKKGKLLEDQNYYVGMLNGTDVAAFLTKVGDFGVHAIDNDDGRVQIQITVRGQSGVYHFDLIFDAKGRGWTFYPMPPKSKFHKTIIALVDYHKTTPLPSLPEKICLIDSLTRPKWMLNCKSVKYDENDLLGKGNFCKVFRGKLDHRKAVAVKVCGSYWTYTTGNALYQVEKEARDGLIQEAYIMAKIRHPNVVTFYGICCDHPPILVALEFCQNSLDKFLKEKRKCGLSKNELIKFAAEVCSGMKCLEENAVVHRDLAARNCLISENGVIKVADFGLSKLVSQLSGINFNNQHIPVRWMSPETLKPNPQFSSKSDVWSFGVLCFEIFTYAKKPWKDWENRKIATHIRKGQMLTLPPEMPIAFKMLVSKMWTMKSSERPDFAEISKRINQIQGVYPEPKEFTAKLKPPSKQEEPIEIEAAISSLSHES